MLCPFASDRTVNTGIGIYPGIIVVALLIGFFNPPRHAVNAAEQGCLVWVKYRPTPVNISHPRFKYLDTSRSSFVTTTKAILT